MLICSITRRQLLHRIAAALAVIAAAGIIIAAIMSSLTVAAASRKLPIYCVERNDKKIALTFDCAWGNSNTDRLLEILSAAQIKATFFVTGEFCDNYPDDVRRISAAGHEIANHSDSHPHIEGININDLIADTKTCADKIKMLTGAAPTLYRAPYGEYDDNSVATVEGMGYKYIQWSVDSIDWENPDSATIKKRILDGVCDGAILLFHNDLSNTEQALPEILAELASLKYKPVTVSELIYADNYHIDNTGKQISDVETRPTVIYSENYLVNEALEIMRTNLTLEEIYSLTAGANVAVIDKITPLLSAAQIAAIQEMSYEELKTAITALVAAAEQDGAAEYPLELAAETTTEPPATTAAETTASPVTTEPKD